MKKVFLLAFIAGCIAGCGKDKFKTEPQIEINSFGPEEVVKGQFIRLIATVTDKEGDLQDTLTVVRKVHSLAGVTLRQDSSIKYSLKAIASPQKDKIEVLVTLIYGEQADGAVTQNTDNLDRKFTIELRIRDNAGNRAKSVESDTLILRKI